MLSSPARPQPWRAPVANAIPTVRVPWLSSRHFTLVVVTLSLPFIFLAGLPLYGDIWWVLASGRVLVEQGQLLQADPFTFAPHTSGYFDAQWLAQLLYYSAYRALGLEGVSVLNAATVTVTFGILLCVAWERCRNVVAASAAILLTELTAVWFLHPRAQTLSFAAFAAMVWLLGRHRPRAQTIVAIALVQALWTNLHGSFFLGPVLALVFIAGETIEAVLGARWRSLLGNPRIHLLLLALVGQALGSLATPYGTSIYTYLLKFSVDPIIRAHIVEWLPTTASDVLGAIFFASVALTFGIVALARSRVAATDLLMLLLFGVLGLQAYRNIPWWALASAPIAATYLARIRIPAAVTRIGACLVTSRRPLRGNLFRGALLGIVLFASLPWIRAANPWLADQHHGMVSPDYPEAATAYLASHPSGSHIFSDHAWSSYLDWRLWPTYQPMMDPSIEVHPGNVWIDILTLNQGHASWEELADTYGVDLMLLRPETQRLLISAVERSLHWTPVYHDDQSVIFVRADQA